MKTGGWECISCAGEHKDPGVRGGLPPSVGDADISPSRGEMDRQPFAPLTLSVGEKGLNNLPFQGDCSASESIREKKTISPPVGEMSAKLTEGGWRGIIDIVCRQHSMPNMCCRHRLRRFNQPPSPNRLRRTGSTPGPKRRPRRPHLRRPFPWRSRSFPGQVP